jgi:hypothetical protein
MLYLHREKDTICCIYTVKRTLHIVSDNVPRHKHFLSGMAVLKILVWTSEIFRSATVS